MDESNSATMLAVYSEMLKQSNERLVSEIANRVEVSKAYETLRKENEMLKEEIAGLTRTSDEAYSKESEDIEEGVECQSYDVTNQ